MNPLSLIGGLSLQIKALLVAGIAIASFASGWKVHGWKTDAKQGHSITKQIKTGQGLTNDSKPIIQTKIVKEREIQYVYRNVRKENNELDDNRICFSPESLSLWNAAIAGTNTDSDRTKPTRETASTDTASAKEVINNAADNFETCNSNSVKHNALIDKIETLDGKMCVCAR